MLLFVIQTRQLVGDAITSAFRYDTAFERTRGSCIEVRWLFWSWLYVNSCVHDSPEAPNFENCVPLICEYCARIVCEFKLLMSLGELV